MLINVYVLRILAIVLIVSAHIGVLSPSRALVLGGYLGNSIFFMISGVGLGLSFNKSPMPFPTWVRRRYLKLIIPVILFTFATEFGNVDNFISRAIFFLVPHSSTQIIHFIPNLMVLYFLFFFLNKLDRKTLAILAVCVPLIATCIYFVFYRDFSRSGTDLVSQGIFFPLNALTCFLMGIIASKSADDSFINDPSTTKTITALLVCVLSVIVHSSLKKSNVHGLFVNYIMNFITVGSLFASTLFINKISFVERHIKTIITLSSLSLAVYIIHFKVISTLTKTMAPTYTAVIYVYAISFSLAYAANTVSALVMKKLRL